MLVMDWDYGMTIRKSICFIAVGILIVIQKLSVAATCLPTQNSIVPVPRTLKSIQARAMSGNTYAQAQIGAAYLAGEGLPLNRNEGIYWITKSARGGNAEGQYLLGAYYAQHGKTRDQLRIAAQWLKRAENQSCIPALAILGMFTQRGKGGIPKDAARGCVW